MSPSAYDTAQALYLAPPGSNIWPALEWLLSVQATDGGWGDPAWGPRTREVPTLAALLALHKYGQRKDELNALQAGLAFLRRSVSDWNLPLPDDLPVGIELIVPYLTEQALHADLPIPQVAAASLDTIGAPRRAGLMRLRPGAGTPAVHSWEAWGGSSPDLSVVDQHGGIGSSPAATVAWLHATKADPTLHAARARALEYLEAASQATGTGIPGVMPTAWPIDRFEQTYALHTLWSVGLLNHPRLRDTIAPHIDSLDQLLRQQGVGFNDTFTPDADDTAAALAVLHASRRAPDMARLNVFASDNHYQTYEGELQPSVITTARAVQCRVLSGQPTAAFDSWLLDRQGADGLWISDKWNGAPLYSTWQVILALIPSGHQPALITCREGILAHQHRDGGWGDGGSSTFENTAYAVLALRTLWLAKLLSEQAEAALTRGEIWLQKHYQPFAVSSERHWLAKVRYRPERVSRVIELVALLPREMLSLPYDPPCA